MDRAPWTVLSPVSRVLSPLPLYSVRSVAAHTSRTFLCFRHSRSVAISRHCGAPHTHRHARSTSIQALGTLETPPKHAPPYHTSRQPSGPRERQQVQRATLHPKGSLGTTTTTIITRTRPPAAPPPPSCVCSSPPPASIPHRLRASAPTADAHHKLLLVVVVLLVVLLLCVLRVQWVYTVLPPPVAFTLSLALALTLTLTRSLSLGCRSRRSRRLPTACQTQRSAA